jgi:hypothetical protein
MHGFVAWMSRASGVIRHLSFCRASGAFAGGKTINGASHQGMGGGLRRCAAYPGYATMPRFKRPRTIKKFYATALISIQKS